MPVRWPTHVAPLRCAFAVIYLPCYYLYSRYAGVAEWQTRMVQVHVGATP
jgi:hypothetical protein